MGSYNVIYSSLPRARLPPLDDGMHTYLVPKSFAASEYSPLVET